MIAVRSIVQAALIAGCAAVSLIAIHVSVPSKAETAPHAISASKVDAIALKLAEDRDEALRPMSPIYPTIKYTAAQLAVPAATSHIKAKKVARSKRNMPLQIAYVPTIATAYTH
jgi:hypothetical protein